MAYAYPADPASSSSSLVPGLTHILAPHSRDVSRQSSGGGFDVLLVIKVCFSAQYSARNAEWWGQEKLQEDEDYISFFQERYVSFYYLNTFWSVVRIRVEENYIAGLTTLHSRAVAVDSLKEESVRVRILTSG